MFKQLMETEKTKPTPRPEDTPEARYYTALVLVRVIDRFLEEGSHFRDSSGQLLDSLDKVVQAALDGRWVGLISEEGSLVNA